MLHVVSAMAAAHPPPRNSETRPTVAAVPGLRADQNQRFDCAESGADRQEDYGKRLARLTARLAAIGFTLQPLYGDTLIISRWGLSRTVADLTDVERFLLRAGGRNA